MTPYFDGGKHYLSRIRLFAHCNGINLPEKSAVEADLSLLLLAPQSVLPKQ